MTETFPKQPVKVFMAPVWVMGSIVCVRILITINTLLAIGDLRRHGGEVSKFGLYSGLAVMGIALAEAILYWRIRRKKYRKTPARWHLMLMLVSMVALPVLFISFTRIMRYYISSLLFVDMVRTFGRMQFYIFWICFLGGTALFVMVITSAYAPAEENIEDRIDAIGDD